MQKTHLVILSAALLLGAGAFAAAQAGPQVYHPLTHAAGAPGDWNQDAGYRVFGSNSANVYNVSPYFVTSTTYDNSSNLTTVAGDQVDVQASAQITGDNTQFTTTTSSGK